MNKSQATSTPAPMTPVEYLKSIDRKTVEADLDAAKSDVSAAMGRVRALRQMLRMIDWRDGKSAFKKRKKSADQPAQDALADAVEAVEIDLGKHGASSPLQIAQRTALAIPVVKEALADQRFRQVGDRFTIADHGPAAWK